MRIALFATCLGDQFFAEAVADAVRLLRHLDVEVAFPSEQTCCGQPSHNAGHRAEAVRMARHTVRAFEGYDHVVLPSGSCAAMLRHGYPKLLGDGPGAGDGGSGGEGAGPFHGRAWELAEFLVEVLRVDHLGDGLEGRRLAYHHGCHALRELGLETQATSLLEGSGARVVPWEADRECCGFGGLFSVKHPSVSAAMADRKLDTLRAEPPYVLTSADGGCLLHLEGRIRKRGLGIPVRPLASLLWEATGRATDEGGTRREASGGD